MIIVGVDPGAYGALVVVDTMGRTILDALDMPMVRHGSWKIVDGAVVLLTGSTGTRTSTGSSLSAPTPGQWTGRAQGRSLPAPSAASLPSCWPAAGLSSW